MFQITWALVFVIKMENSFDLVKLLNLSFTLCLFFTLDVRLNNIPVSKVNCVVQYQDRLYGKIGMHSFPA